MKDVFTRLKALDDRKLAIYGLGEIGYVFLHCAMAANLQIKYLIDKNKAGQTIEGYEVKDMYDIVDELPSLNIMICVGESKEQKKVMTQLIEIGVDESRCCLPSYLFISNPNFDIFDPILGYDKQYEIDGYKIYPAKAANKKVVIYGGSTTDHSYATFRSWPECCAGYLEQANSDYLIYNGAARGYCTKQEMMKCVRDIVSLNPSVVISYNGINDAIKYANQNCSANVKAHFPDDYLSHIIDGMIDNGITSYKKTGYGLENPSDCIANWINHVRTMHAVCEEFNIDFHVFIQPSLFLGNYQISDYERKFLSLHSTQEFCESMRYFFLQIIEKSADYPYIHDLTDLFNERENMYIDYVHASASGNEVIGQYVCNFINNKR